MIYAFSLYKRLRMPYPSQAAPILCHENLTMLKGHFVPEVYVTEGSSLASYHLLYSSDSCDRAMKLPQPLSREWNDPPLLKTYLVIDYAFWK